MSQIMKRKQTKNLLNRDRFILLVLILSLSFWTVPQMAEAQWATNGNNINNTNSGNVGIGVTSPLYKLHIGDSTSNTVPYIGFNGTPGTASWTTNLWYRGIHLGIAVAQRFQANANLYYLIGSKSDKLLWGTATKDDNTVGTGYKLALDSAGNFGIGTITPTAKLHVSGNSLLGGGVTVTGNMTVNGNIAAKYQDVAEWVTSPKAMPSGTVVILHPEQTNQVLPSMKAYDTRVAGVISEMPGILLGEAGEDKVKVATTGRVKVKVDATKRPVQVGDLLVTSDKEGIAMKSEPLDLGGVPIHRPGTLIGKALEPLAEGEGEILVLLSLQ